MRLKGNFIALGALIPGALACAALPTNDEQYFLEITNRMRLNPQAELRILTNINYGSPPTWGSPKSSDPNVDNALQYFGTNANTLVTQWSALTPVQALAWNTNLGDSSLFHANYLISYAHDHPTEDAQQHNLPGEPIFQDRLLNANYQYTAAGENLYAYAYNAFHGHAGFAIDWGPNSPSGIQNPPGHRNNIMNADYDFRETGIAILPENDPTTLAGPLVINMDFGRRSGNAFLTGVLYNDLITPNHFYTPGEGLGGVTVTVYNAGTSTVKGSTATWASGGYSLQLAAGTYDVKLSGGGLGGDIIYNNVVMGTSNVKLDSETHWLPSGGGSWTNPANWNAGVPNGIGTHAFLTSYLGIGGAITVNSAVTVGQIDLDATGAFTLSGTDSIKLDASSGQARINAVGFNHAISTPLILNDDTAINISGDLALTGGLQNPSGKTITRSGSGTLRIAGAQTHGLNANLNITSGTVRLQSDAGTAASAASAASANLAIDISGINSKLLVEADQELRNLTTGVAGVGNQSIDLAGHALHIYSPTLSTAKIALWTAIESAVATPLDGIYDSTLASHVNARVGLAILPDAHGDSHLLIRPTRIGDLNLDGNVTIADFIDLASNFNLAGSATWQEGDLNADGTVSIADFIDLASNFNTSYSGDVFPISASDQQLLSTFAASIGVSVPEPAAISLMLISASFVVSRRRR